MTLSYHRYGLKLRGLAGGNARSERRVLEGFLIRVDDGYGCVQPWPELGDETLEAQWAALQAGGGTRLVERALAGARVDGAARREGRSLFAVGMPPPESHATVTGKADFAALAAGGFGTVKLKGGQELPEVLERMRQAVAAGLRVRVDFNGVLTEEAFLDFAQRLRTGGLADAVDFIEDPMPYDAASWNRMRLATGLRLALDRLNGIEEGGFDVRVLKPAVDAMDQRPVPVVVTSYMDHPLGQAFAAWESARYAGEKLLGGLLTHRLFEPDAFSGRLAAAGPGWVGPGGTGLGFDDLLEALPWVEIGRRNRAGRVLQNARDPLPDGGPALEVGEVGFATSGSTGVPSVLVHTEETLEASARAVNAWLGAKVEDVWLRVLPDFHVGGYQIGVRAALSGSRVVREEGKWQAERFVRLCDSEGVTLTSLVPAQVLDVVQTGLEAPPGLRSVVVGGGALEDGLWQQARGLGWPVLASYGCTEAASQVATELPAGVGQGAPADQPGPLLLLPHWEARVGNAGEGARESPESAAGLLELRGRALALRRYVRRGTGWHAEVLADGQGWWRSADRVRLSGRELRFAGRVDRVVKVLGELVNLEAVERDLSAAGLEAGRFAVVALPDERRGAALVLAWETRQEGRGPDAETLVRYAASAAPFARIVRVAVVAELPRSPLGKIRYEELSLSLSAAPG